ncbi:MAG: hypothetical protein CMI53_02590 [Parcubacteria group bacterium]|jgi:DNA-binding FrmR family transcriptional regulator|nr:hypothetical protein [Parcubacteria group bacterium]|tara:strand:+ start:1785 stop:2027 length:243 start_codon:yes stop_codon:yes gene_type:complete
MTQPSQKPELSQLHRLQGQLKGVEKMINKDYKISDVIQQLEAVRGNLKSLERKLLTEKIKNFKEKDEDFKKAVNFILKIS